MKDIGQNIVSHQIRYDLEIIANLIKPNSKVLDIGCGDGELMQFLKKNKNVDARGLEISQQKVSKALMSGLSVIHGNADDDLSAYPNQSFDYTVLSQTLQATQNPKEVLEEMLRISRFAIVSLPNFAHIQNRLHLMLKGTMPVNKTIPFEWYETPNIHFCSIHDFEKLCANLNFKIEKRFFLTSKKQLLTPICRFFIANLFAQYGIFLISKKEFSPTLQEEFAFGRETNLGFGTSPQVSLIRSK
jgi:methionine biosynthesis protein MetW